MQKIKYWIAAARLRTLPLAISNIVMGAVLSAFYGSFSWIILGLTLITAILLQILSNFANEYGDFIHGADHTEREGPNRTVQSGQITANQMKKAINITAVLSILSGCILLFFAAISLSMKVFFLILGLVAVWAAINYTSGPSPYGYKGFGDLSVFLFFGLLSVVGSYFLQSNTWRWSILLPAISCGVFSMAVLNINNIRDIQSDQVAGKTSLAIKLGRNNAVKYHLVLLSTGILTAGIYMLYEYDNPIQFLFLSVAPLLIINYRAVKNKTAAMSLDPYLKQMALTTLLFVIMFSIGLLT